MRIDTHLEVPGDATQAHVVAAKVGRGAVEDVRSIELVPAFQHESVSASFCQNYTLSPAPLVRRWRGIRARILHALLPTALTYTVWACLPALQLLRHCISSSGLRLGSG